jgi:uncharacterized protein YlxP (DUF503 family)
MQVLALRVEVHIPAAGSLKAKRQVVKSIVESARHRYGVASAEVGHQELWQRSSFGFAAVGGSAEHVTEVIDEVERFVWSHAEVEVTEVERTWLEPD